MEMITIKDKEFKLDIEYKNIKNLYMKVKEDTIVVSCNKRVKKQFIYDFIKKKENWIIKKSGNSKVGINDNEIYFRGKSYHIRYIYDTNERIDINEDDIVFYAAESDNEYLLNLFYKELYQDLLKSINKYYDFCYNSLSNYRILKPVVGIKHYKSRWGSCNYSKREIYLNITLIHFSEDIVKAVLLHEFVHLVHQNHSKDYYNLLLSIMPDYREIHKELK